MAKNHAVAQYPLFRSKIADLKTHPVIYLYVNVTKGYKKDQKDTVIRYCTYLSTRHPSGKYVSTVKVVLTKFSRTTFMFVQINFYVCRTYLLFEMDYNL